MISEQEIKYYYNLGKTAYTKNNYTLAIEYFNKVINMIDNEAHNAYLANAFDYVGHCYKSMGYDIFDKAEEYLYSNKDVSAEYTKAKENFLQAIKYIKVARKMFRLEDVAAKLTKEKAKIYIERCTDIIESCNYYIEKCNERIEFVK